MRKDTFNILGALTIFSWAGMTYLLFTHRPSNEAGQYQQQFRDLTGRVGQLESKVKDQLKENSVLLEKLKDIKGKGGTKFEDITGGRKDEPGTGGGGKFVDGANEYDGAKKDEKVEDSVDVAVTGQRPQESVENDEKPVIAILLFACNRVTVNKAIDSLLVHRPDKERFPIVVSQDCAHEETAQVIRGYGDQIIFIQQPDQSRIRGIPKKERKFEGYFKIARHYGWALNHTFNDLGYDQAIVVEDDLEVAPDFYEYFRATLPILKTDKSLFCVSAWNDNGKQGLIDDTKPEKLYRTDFFGGLGWMLTKELWQSELMLKWPRSYWDDWIRQPNQRRGRACIRPEISRTRTFGRKGVSQGLFFDKHLKFIQLNTKFVPFTVMDLNYLRKENYDTILEREIMNTPVVSTSELRAGTMKGEKALRIIYHTKESFRRTAKFLSIMDDFKSGVPRTAYKGIVSVLYNGQRVYVAPNLNWKGYDESW